MKTAEVYARHKNDEMRILRTETRWTASQGAKLNTGNVLHQRETTDPPEDVAVAFDKGEGRLCILPIKPVHAIFAMMRV